LSLEEGFDDAGVFLGIDAAGAVHEQSTGTHPGGGALTIDPTMAEVTATVAVTAAAVAIGW
jgi:hypothetical protein